MCEVCKAEGVDTIFKNGPKTKTVNNVLYKVFKNSVATIRLCRVHSIELFQEGEKRFLGQHLEFTRHLAKNRKNTTIDESSQFGF